MQYPTKEEIEKADQQQLAKWYRFLESPKNESESELLSLICDKFKGFSAELSKKVGWDKN